mmetsp:Transcript_23027/g.35612  ORF Transcript_23027/g.35612 Transcript_23027/m.35612 type:complete len:123 (+) Transcript_23027:249-617(+)
MLEVGIRTIAKIVEVVEGAQLQRHRLPARLGGRLLQSGGYLQRQNFHSLQVIGAIVLFFSLLFGRIRTTRRFQVLLLLLVRGVGRVAFLPAVALDVFERNLNYSLLGFSPLRGVEPLPYFRR